jgi:iron complex transport system ATP-binding protein
LYSIVLEIWDNSNVLYSLDRVQFSYDQTLVLKDVQLSIESGAFVSFVGPNGAGKSTLLKILAGLLGKYRGQVTFGGRSLASLTAREIAKEVAFVAQETHVMFPFSVGEMILMGRLPRQKNALFESARDIQSAREAMALTDTTHLAGKIFNQLSGGERQRAVLASALAQDPQVLLLDEPTVYLDLKHQIQFYDIIEKLNSERGITVLSVTHDINLAARYSRRMIAIRDGQIVADGPPESVLTAEKMHDIFEVRSSVVRRPDGRGVYVVPAC